MQPQAWIFFFFCFISLSMSLSVSWQAWRQRRYAGARTFAIMAFLQALWTFGYIAELAGTTLEQKTFWDSFQYIGSFSIPVAMLIFAREYGQTNLPHVNRWWLALMAAPVLYIIVVYIDPYGPLSRVNPVLTPMSPQLPFGSLSYEYPRALYWMFIYSYLVLIFAIGSLIRRIVMSRGVFRAQMMWVTGGMLIPIIMTIGTLTGTVEIFGQRDISPVTFGISSVVVLTAMARYRLFDLVPVARERVAEVMRDGVLTLDADHRLVDFNPASRLMLGLQNSAYGQLAQAVCPWLPTPNPNDEIHSDIQVGTPELPIYYDVSLSPLHDRSGQHTGTVVLIRDVSARVQAQQSLERLYQEQVAVAEKLRAVDTMKSQFLASMSHELRTPLNAILNFTEFVALGMLGDVNDAQVDALNKSIDSGRHLLSLINDVLDMTKIESGMMKLFIENDIDLHKEVEPVISTAQTLLADKPEVRLVQDIDAELPILSGDRRRIRQILLNLVSNAVKFTEQGSITLAIKNRPDEVLFAVIDTGPGINLADQPMIFEPFQQTETGIRHAGGTGLGLPISKRLVEAHGGRLWVESHVGEGAAFYFSLPLKSPVTHPERPALAKVETI